MENLDLFTPVEEGLPEKEDWYQVYQVFKENGQVAREGYRWIYFLNGAFCFIDDFGKKYPGKWWHEEDINNFTGGMIRMCFGKEREKIKITERDL